MGVLLVYSKIYTNLVTHSGGLFGGDEKSMEDPED
jgi:hypothetical protein